MCTIVPVMYVAHVFTIITDYQAAVLVQYQSESVMMQEVAVMIIASFTFIVQGLASVHLLVQKQ
ncbi:hypothetical protein D3C80_2065850 [compost metagenome]